MTSDIDDGSTPAYNPVKLWIVENLMGAESPNEVPGINVGIALAVVALVWWVIAIGEWATKPGGEAAGGGTGAVTDARVRPGPPLLPYWTP